MKIITRATAIKNLKKYIPCERHWKDMFAQYSMFRVVEKFPLRMIKKKKLRNDLDTGAVLYMLVNFNRSAWMPIILDGKYFLLDGQHRLRLAEQMGLEYMDAVVQV